MKQLTIFTAISFGISLFGSLLADDSAFSFPASASASDSSLRASTSDSSLRASASDSSLRASASDSSLPAFASDSSLSTPESLIPPPESLVSVLETGHSHYSSSMFEHSSEAQKEVGDFPL